MSKLINNIKISINNLSLDEDSVENAHSYVIGRDVQANIYFTVTFTYLPTKESWDEPYYAELYGIVYGGYHYPETYYEPEKNGWRYVKFNEVHFVNPVGDDDSEPNIPKAIDMDELCSVDFFKEITDKIAEEIKSRLPYKACEDWEW